MKITRVYTRTGDKGETSIVGGYRVRTSDLRLEAYGTVAELSAHIGLLVAMLPSGEDTRKLIHIQNVLFNVCSNLATDQSKTPLYPSAIVDKEEIKFLEDEVDRMMGLLPERQGFILPGGLPAAAQAHVCRTVCRRAERRIVSLAEVAQVSDEVQQYVNRLSDYFFVLAKIINFNEGKSEIIWENHCKYE